MVHKILRYSLWIFLFYFLISVIIVPIRHKEVSELPAVEGAPGRVRCIDDNQEALLWRLRVIESAQSEIVMSTFDWREDNSGTDMMAALEAAAERGVQIRLIVDGINGFLQLRGSGMFQALTANPNVEAKLYNPVNLLLPFRINYRMHDKYLIADESVYILGGRNTNDLFLGNYRDSYNLDRDLLVYEGENGESGSLGAVRSYFEKVWSDPVSKPYRHHKSARKTQQAQEELRERYEKLKSDYPVLLEETDWQGETTEAESIALLVNPAQAAGKEPVVFEQIFREIKQGQDVLIQTPYIICDGRMYRGLREAVEGGTGIQIITNAVESGANPWGCTDYLNQKGKILRTGVSVYECLAGQSLHTKTVLVDQDVSIIGSYNLDIRSTYLDTEMMLRVESRELNRAIRADAEQYQEKSKLCTPDGQETENSGYQKVRLSLPKKGIYQLLRVVILPIRHLL